jgi:hypothetical protein
LQNFLYLLPVRKKGDHIGIWKQRASLMLVMFFCMLISGMEYIPDQEANSNKSIKELNQGAADQTEHQTFLNIAVDAVVPFVTVLGQQVFYLIFENIVFEKPSSTGLSISLPLNLPFWEVLLEQIISTNAP